MSHLKHDGDSEDGTDQWPNREGEILKQQKDTQRSDMYTVKATV